jgi:hypothetical protein
MVYDGVTRAAICLIFAIACSSKSEAPRAEPPPAGARAAGSAGAGDRAVEATADPAAETRVDRDPAGPPPARTAAPRAARPIDIVLRSSPPGATAAVDGVPIGPTPTYWSGDANGREHEFTFVLPGYAFARYRFVPITSGVVHARLEVLADDNDAGVPAEMMRFVPDAAPDPAPRAPEPRAPGPRAPGPPEGAPPSEALAPADAAPSAGPQP